MSIFNDFPVGLFVMQLVIFLLLLLLLAKFAWKPIMASISDREDGIREAMEGAEKAKLEMENLIANNEAAKREAIAERDNLLKEAREMKDQIIAEAKEQAQVEAGKMIEQAKETITSEKNAAMAELKSTVSGIAVEIAEKVVRQELSNKDQQLALIEKSLAEVVLN